VTGSRLASLTSHPRLRRLFVAGLVVAGILFTFANPARTWYDQHQDIAAARERNVVLEEQSRQLRARAEQLATDAEVERLARSDYGLVKPGEEAFGILPTPGAGPPRAAPPPPPEPRSWWRSARDTLTFWD